MKNNLMGFALEEYKTRLVLTEIQKDILVGTLLGDASMQAMKLNQLSNVKFEQKFAQKDYVDHLYEHFSDWVGTPPQIRSIKGGGAKDRQSVWFRTYRHPAFTLYKSLFYRVDSQGKQYKVVPDNILDLLTPRALAYWFMDDGSTKRLQAYDNKISSFVFNTQGFSEDQQLLLLNALLTRYKFDATLFKDRHYRLVAIRSKSKDALIEKIQPYIIPSFQYKIS